MAVRLGQDAGRIRRRLKASRKRHESVIPAQLHETPRKFLDRDFRGVIVSAQTPVKRSYPDWHTFTQENRMPTIIEEKAGAEPAGLATVEQAAAFLQLSRTSVYTLMAD